MLIKRNDSVLVLVDAQEKLIPAVLNHEQMISRCDWLLKLATNLNIPILVSEQYTKGLGPTVAPLNNYINQSNCIEKVHFSCMQEPKYINELNKHRRKQLILIGIEAHVCVLQTALETKEAGYDVFVVVDAVSSRSEMDLKYGLKRLKQDGVHLVTSEMVLFEWIRQAGTDEFRRVSKEFLK